MTPQRLIIAGLALAALALASFLFLAPKFKHVATLSGYVEGEPLYLASPVSGMLTELKIQRGDRVAGGEALFVIDPRQLTAAQAQAEQELKAAQAQAADARKGQRPVELAAFDASVAAAQAQLRDAENTYNRIAPLVRSGIYAPARLDDARSARDTAAANLKAAMDHRTAAALGQREDLVRAADAKVSQASAGLSAAAARVTDLAPVSPGPARVEDVFYQRGEWVAANQPVAALLPDEKITIRFFVPEREISAYLVGKTVHFACDACPAGLTARITYVSPTPEFTPPVIYSLESRDRLVFLVEARPDHPERLPPGLPVDVTPLMPEPKP